MFIYFFSKLFASLYSRHVQVHYLIYTSVYLHLHANTHGAYIQAHKPYLCVCFVLFNKYLDAYRENMDKTKSTQSSIVKSVRKSSPHYVQCQQIEECRSIFFLFFVIY